VTVVFKFSLRYHYRVFKDWQKKNQIVTLKIGDKCFLANSFLKKQNGSNIRMMDESDHKQNENQNEVIINKSNDESIQIEMNSDEHNSESINIKILNLDKNNRCDAAMIQI
jgi:hypothetical protein